MGECLKKRVGLLAAPLYKSALVSAQPPENLDRFEQKGMCFVLTCASVPEGESDEQGHAQVAGH